MSGKARQGGSGPGLARLVEAGTAGQGMARHGLAGLGMQAMRRLAPVMALNPSITVQQAALMIQSEAA